MENEAIKIEILSIERTTDALKALLECGRATGKDVKSWITALETGSNAIVDACKARTAAWENPWARRECDEKVHAIAHIISKVCWTMIVDGYTQCETLEEDDLECWMEDVIDQTVELRDLMAVMDSEEGLAGKIRWETYLALLEDREYFCVDCNETIEMTPEQKVRAELAIQDDGYIMCAGCTRAHEEKRAESDRRQRMARKEARKEEELRKQQAAQGTTAGSV